MSHYKLLKEIEYLYEDDEVIVVSKPSGLLSIPDRFKVQSNLKDVLMEKCGEIYTVHRLEKDTSGIMVFAKNEAAHKFLNNQFAQQEVEKIYWAFVQNVPEIESGIIDVPILNDIKKTGRMHISKDGKEAQTKFKLLNNYGKISLLAFAPITGRTHQIRVHSKYLGCPLLIDSLYAKKDFFFLSEIKRSYKNTEFEDEKPFIKRLTLHAKSMTIKLPNGDIKTFESKLPKDLSALKKQLDKILG